MSSCDKLSNQIYFLYFIASAPCHVTLAKLDVATHLKNTVHMCHYDSMNKPLCTHVSSQGLRVSIAKSIDSTQLEDIQEFIDESVKGQNYTKY